MPIKGVIFAGVCTIFQLMGLAIAAVALWVLVNVLPSQPHWLVRLSALGFIGSTLAVVCLTSARMWSTYSDQAGCSWTRLSGSTFVVNFWKWCLLSGASAVGFLLLLWIAGRLRMFV
jgi:hypothetical protein